jgi:hypothetical protein
VRLAEVVVEDTIGEVRIGTVAHIVEERGVPHIGGFVVGERERARGERAEVVCAQSVLEARVVRARVDEVRGPELMDAPQALHARRVDERERAGVERDVVVDGVADLLHGSVARKVRTTRRRHVPGR